MHFQTWGPFELALGKDGNWRSGDFWESVEAMAEIYQRERGELSSAIGCYLFTTKYGKTYTPWYVGKTVSKAGFLGEVLQPHKLRHYNNVLCNKGRRSGHIFLFPLVTENADWRFSHSKGEHRVIDWLEKTMIGMAIRKNFDAMNLKDTKFIRNIWVEGIFNDSHRGTSTAAARAVKNALL